MANDLKLTITLRKNVADDAEAVALTAIVRQKLESHPDVEITAHTAKRIDQ